MWETRIREGRRPRWLRTLVLGFGGAILLTLGAAPGVRAAAVDHFSISDRTVTEGNAGTVNATFTISYTGAKNDLTVDWSTADGTALAGVDYVAASGTATFTSGGPRSVTITVQVLGDVLDEANETFTVNLANPQPPATADITDPQGIGRINDDDPLPSITIDDPTVAEGNAGTTTLTYTLTLSAPSGRAVNVRAATANGTATQPADYVAITQNLVFNPGETTLSFPVTVNGDLLDEADADTVRANLSSVTNATIADAQGVGSILDDDALPSLSIADASRTEGNSGTANLTFTVTLTPVSGRTVTVGWATTDATAVAPADYTGVSGTVTFSAGQTTRTFTVPVVGDTMDEFNETFVVDLASPTNATISDGQAVGTIVDNDAPPRLSVNDVGVAEGDAGTVTATFAVSLSAISGKPISVDVATVDGTAVAGADYTAATTSLAFAPGDLSATVDVGVDGDTMDEFDEVFTLLLSNASNATILDGVGLGSIVDDDLPPALSIGDLIAPEGDAGTSVASVPVNLSAVSGKTITVDFSTADVTATAGSDYTAAAGTLTFVPGLSAATIDLTIAGDTTYESDEDLTVSLTNETNAALADGTAAATIANDDPLPGIVVDDAGVTEGNAGDAVLTFTVSLSNPSAFPVGVDVATADGSAAQPGDYDPVVATLAFAPGELTRTVDVTVHGDVAFERDETLTVDLSNATGATIADGTGVGTIANDDAAPVVDVAGVTVTEGDAGDTIATFALTLTGTTDLPATVDASTVDGTAGAPVDLAATAATVTFAPGDTAETVDVAVHGDTTYELDEAFTLQLSAPVDAAIGTGTATGTILNDDPLPTVSITNALAIEGNAGTAQAAFAVSLSNPSAFPVTVDAATADGTAMSPADYAATAATVAFAPGDVVASFDVPVNGDGLYEGDETFTVTLANPSGGTLGTASATGTIVDDEAQPILSIDDVTLAEGHAGTTPATFTVSLSVPSGSPTTVDAATADGTAASPDDYGATAATVTFAPGDTTAAFTVDVVGDRGAEPDEAFTVGLSGAVGAAAIGDATGLGTIVNDDHAPIPTVAIGSGTVGEGDAGTTTLTLGVRLSHPAETDVALAWSTSGGSATPGVDFLAASGELTIAAGLTTSTITVSVFGDTVAEPDEAFSVVVEPLRGAAAGTGGSVTIANDDRATTRMSVRGRGIHGSRIVVRGRLVALATGNAIDVTLYRRVGRGWSEVGSVSVSTIATARRSASGSEVTLFRARFRHLEPGRYLVRAVFAGDDLESASHARDRFRLR